MRLSVRALAITVGLFWAFSFLFVAIINYLWPPYGKAFLEILSSLYPGYKAVASPDSIIIGTFYAFFDGAIGGAIFAWLYNTFRN